MQTRYTEKGAVGTAKPILVPPRIMHTAGRLLLVIAAAGAMIAVWGSFGSVSEAGPGTLMLQVWQLAGLAVFAGLFGLLAYRPQHYAGVWELVIVNKLALTLVALTGAVGTDGAEDVAIVDGALTAVLLAAYVLCKGWRSWSSTSTRGG